MLYLLGYSGPGQPADLRQVEREVPRARRQRPDPGAARRAARAARSTLGLARSPRSSATPTARTSSPSSRAARPKPVTADQVVLALPFSILRASVDYSKAGFEPRQDARDQRAGHGHQLQAARPVHRPLLARLGCNGDTYADTGYQNTWEVTRAQAGTLGDPGRLHRRHHRRELRQRHAGERARSSSSAQIEPVLPGHHRQVQRQGDGRLLDRHTRGRRAPTRYWKVGQYTTFAGRRARALGQLPLRRRAHLDRLPGLPQRRPWRRASAPPTRSSADLK